MTQAANQPTEQPEAQGQASPPPPPGAGPSEARRLVRDPTARLGGVASGLAHYYGIDVALVRIGIIALSLLTFVGFVAYVLAWIIIPRSDYWPPLDSQPVASPSKMSNRDLIVAFVVMLGVAALLIPGRWGPGWVVPVLLVAAGVWLLNQQAKPEPSPASQPGSSMPAPQPVDDPFQPPTADQPQDTLASPGDGTPAPTAQFGTATAAQFGTATAAQPTPAPLPVKVPRRRRRGLVTVLVGLFLLVVVVPVALVIAVIVGIVDGRIDIATETRSFEPETVADIPPAVEFDAGEIIVDLRQLDPADFDAEDPVQLEISLGFGSATVYVPDGLNVDVSAGAGAGDIEVFGQGSDGVGQSVTTDEADEQLELQMQVGFGEIRVVRD